MRGGGALSLGGTAEKATLFPFQVLARHPRVFPGAGRVEAEAPPLVHDCYYEKRSATQDSRTASCEGGGFDSAGTLFMTLSPFLRGPRCMAAALCSLCFVE